jgi:uncharacterized protein (DUF2267 family)
MPVPPEYQRATDDLYAYLLDARDAAGFGSTHQAYTMTQGVLQTFRRRLSLADAIRFANVLPAGLRAIFVSDWDPEEAVRPFGSRDEMAREVRALRAEHNYSPDDAIDLVGSALRRHVDEPEFDRVLARLPEGSVDFWAPR